VLGRSDYLPFGETLNQSGTLPRQRFTGQERDGEAGLDYFNARNLQARTGRMNAPDPLFGNAMTNPQRWNRYAYVTNSPLTLTDPSGAAPCPPDCGFTISVDVKAPLTSGGELLSYLPAFIWVSLNEFSPEHLQRIADRELARQARKAGQQPKTTPPGPTDPSDPPSDGPANPTGSGEQGPTPETAAPPSTASEAAPTPWTVPKIARCAADQFGLQDLFAAGGIAAGWPIPGSKPFVTPGSVDGTSLAGMAADRIFGSAKFPTRVPTLTGGPGAGRVLKIVRTRSVARFAGRAVPVLGWGMLAYDAASIALCSAR
jgi:RHS repeat-associated protein